MTSHGHTISEIWRSSHARAALVKFLPIVVSASLAAGGAYWAIFISNLRLEVMVYQLKEAEMPLLLSAMADIQKARDIRIGYLAGRLYRIENILMSGVTDGEVGADPDKCRNSKDPGTCFIERANREFILEGPPSGSATGFRRAIIEVDRAAITDLLEESFRVIRRFADEYMNLQKGIPPDEMDAQGMREYIKRRLIETQYGRLLKPLEQEKVDKNDYVP